MIEVVVWTGLLLAAGLLLWRVVRRGRAEARADWGVGWLNVLDGLNRRFCRRFHGLQADPVDLPEQGPAIVVSNHVSGLDAQLLCAACQRPLRFLIATEQYNRFGMRWLFRANGCIPVDRQGRPERALRHALEQLKTGEVIAMFPYGKIHLDSDPPRPLKRGALLLARISGARLYPLRIDGVRGEGTLLTAIFKRDQVRLRSYPPIDPAGRDDKEVLAELADILDGRRSD